MHVRTAILVGITVLGCKGQEGSKPAAGSGAVAPAPAPKPATVAPTPPAPAGSAAVSAPAVPRLDVAASYDQETKDRDWAINTERAIKAVAPELADVDCKQQSCRATLTAASDAELAAKADALSGENSLRGTTGAKNVLLTAPQDTGGKRRMTIYVRYER